MSKNRRYCFTIFPQLETDDECYICCNPDSWDMDYIKYLIFQPELTPETQRFHYQGYVIFGNSYSLSTLKNKFCSHAKFIVAKGSPEDNIAYCSKEDSRVEGAQPTEKGTRPAPGKRTDLEGVHELVRSGASTADIAENYFGMYVRYSRGIRDAMNVLRPRRNWPCYTTVYWGPPGTGKSTRAHWMAPNAYVLPAPNMNNGAVWWDGYEGQEDVIIDEFYGWIPLTFMNLLCDSKPVHVQTKGGNVNFLAKRIFICSNDPPKDWWPRSYAKHGNLGAMERRLKAPNGEIICMPFGLWKPPVPPPEDPLVPITVEDNVSEDDDVPLSSLMSSQSESPSRVQADLPRLRAGALPICPICGCAGYDPEQDNMCRYCRADETLEAKAGESITVDDVLEMVDSSSEDPDSEDEKFIDDNPCSYDESMFMPPDRWARMMARPSNRRMPRGLERFDSFEIDSTQPYEPEY